MHRTCILSFKPNRITCKRRDKTLQAADMVVDPLPPIVLCYTDILQPNSFCTRFATVFVMLGRDMATCIEIRRWPPPQKNLRVTHKTLDYMSILIIIKMLPPPQVQYSAILKSKIYIIGFESTITYVNKLNIYYFFNDD